MQLSDLIRWVKDVLVVFRNSDAGKADSRAEGKEPERSSGGSKGIDEDRDRDMDRGDKAGPGRNGCVSRAAEAKATGMGANTTLARTSYFEMKLAVVAASLKCIVPVNNDHKSAD